VYGLIRRDTKFGLVTSLCSLCNDSSFLEKIQLHPDPRDPRSGDPGAGAEASGLGLL
jgi:hypothetical protein